MSTSWLQWMLLSWVTGSPITGALLLFVLWWLGDRLTFRVLPDPLRRLGRWRRTTHLRGVLQVNPHDRRTRLELAERLLEGRRPAEAAQVLRPNVEAGDEDVHTAYAMGAALGRSGQPEAGERALLVARQLEPAFRAGEIDLELGRQRVARGDFAGAREALEKLVQLRPGTVEGRYWLARALDGLGDRARAAAVRDEAWREYQHVPRFHRRAERPFAWRIKPWRPALVAVAVLLAAAVVAAACGPLAGGSPYGGGYGGAGYPGAE